MRAVSSMVEQLTLNRAVVRVGLSFQGFAFDSVRLFQVGFGRISAKISENF
jgi:hypothetical protein